MARGRRTQLMIGTFGGLVPLRAARNRCAARARLLYDVIRLQQDRLRDRKTKHFGGLQIDDQLELRWSLDGKLGRLRAPK